MNMEMMMMIIIIIKMVQFELACLASRAGGKLGRAEGRRLVAARRH